MRNQIITIIAIALVGTCVSESRGQERIFTASSLEEVRQRINGQDRRIDVSEQRLARLETAVEKLTEAIRDHPATIKQSLTVSATPAPPQSKPIATSTVQPGRYTAAELMAIARGKYPSGQYYVRHADVQPRSQVYSHLKSGAHGFTSGQVDSLPMWAALAIHDMEHGGEITPWRRAGAVIPQQLVSTPAPQPVVQYSSGCANGQCARPSQGYAVSQRRPLFWRVR